jgi:class 3 adenylate cyclase/esterase/lipase
VTIPETRYAKSGEISIAYQVAGDGPIDIVFVQGFVSHVELAWETPTFAGIFNRLATFSRLIVFDKRGTGLSDRTARMPTLEERMDDMRAVMDAAGSERAALIGISEGGPMSLLFSATYPERTLALVLWATFARNLWAPDYPIGIDSERAARGYHFIQARWGEGRVLRRVSMQDAPDDPVVQQLLARYERNSATPAAAVEALRFGVESDVRHILPAVSVPTLVVHHSGDPLIPVELGRYLAAHISGAQMAEFPGNFHLSAAGGDIALLDAIEEFLSRGPRRHPVERVLKTVLFTDIVSSTERAARLGDRPWRALLDAHDAMVRREIARAGGIEVKATGDGFLAAFDGPARAIRCAQAICAQARALGLELRAGLHTGECEVRGGDLAGIAVHIGARVAALAAPGEILVTGTVRDLVAGSGIEFEGRGEQELKGVPGPWRLLVVRPPNS